MKVKNIFGKSINVECKTLEVNEEREVDKNSHEIKNLIKHKYIEKVEE